MNDYEIKQPRSTWKKALLMLFIAFALLGAGAAIIIRREYQNNLKPASNSETSQLLIIPIGSTPHEIAVMLEDANIIRKAWAFEWYVRVQGAGDDLKAGSYSLKPSQTVTEIVAVLTHGKVATDLVTIFPAKRLDEVRDDLINQGFEAAAVDAALNPALYTDHPALADKPQEANLEGYLYPETFEKIATTEVKDIVLAALDQIQENLMPEVRAGFAQQGLSVHQGIILASIVEREVGSSDPEKDLEDKKKVAQVFLRRLREGIALESDATASYGAVLDGQEPVPGYTSAYNTYQNPGLTPGPISNVGRNSLLAVAEPASTDFLFFVSGDDGVNYFSRTLPEHQKLVREHCSSCP